VLSVACGTGLDTGRALCEPGPRQPHAPLLDQVRATKRAYAPLCYHFQDLRLVHAEMSARPGGIESPRHATGRRRSRTAWPLYGIVTAATGVLSIAVLPRVAGGTGPSFFR
jgi:hypothetical protein